MTHVSKIFGILSALCLGVVAATIGFAAGGYPVSKEEAVIVSYFWWAGCLLGGVGANLFLWGERSRAVRRFR
jgi:protein-S-isoprenylcysteine O-methyltransferase Ste14